MQRLQQENTSNNNKLMLMPNSLKMNGKPSRPSEALAFQSRMQDVMHETNPCWRSPGATTRVVKKVFAILVVSSGSVSTPVIHHPRNRTGKLPRHRQALSTRRR